MYWITGRPGSGKTTFAKMLSVAINEFFKNKTTVILDGDEIRKYFKGGFSLKDRKDNLIRAVKFARLLEDQGFVPICAFVSPTTTLRNLVRSYADSFTLIYIPNDGVKLWEGSTYETPISSEKPHSPDEILAKFTKK